MSDWACFYGQRPMHGNSGMVIIGNSAVSASYGVSISKEDRYLDVHKTDKRSPAGHRMKTDHHVQAIPEYEIPYPRAYVTQEDT